MATNNAINTPQITLGGTFTMTGAYTFAGTLTGNTAVTFPQSGLLSVVGQNLPAVVVSGTTQTMAVNTAYIANNAGTVTFTLPATFAVGDEFEVSGLGAGGWVIAQNASQLIHFGSSVTTTGTGGSLASTNAFDSIFLRAAVANTTLLVITAPQGQLTVV